MGYAYVEDRKLKPARGSPGRWWEKWGDWVSGLGVCTAGRNTRNIPARSGFTVAGLVGNMNRDVPTEGSGVAQRHHSERRNHGSFQESNTWFGL